MTTGAIEGISLLDHFRPPPGYRTMAALATTYSADLVACLALLIAMDGCTSDGLEYTRISALRALERLRERARFVVQANNVGASREDPRILALLDRLVRTVPFDGRERSFHPKVTLALQQCAGERNRYVLFVGSRNLTSSTAWDLGVGLIGHTASSLPAAHRRLPGVKAFVRAIGQLTNDPKLAPSFGGLENVAWELPPDLFGITFRFHRGDVTRFARTALAYLPAGDEALLISPFLTADMVKYMNGHFRSATPIRLVAGHSHLSRIAQTTAWNLIAQPAPRIEALSMTEASDLPMLPTNSEDDAALGDSELAESHFDPNGRDLHAKVFAVSNGSTAHIILGSANLTRHAWLGRNWEAFLVLRGAHDVFLRLSEWSSKNGTIFRIGAQLLAVTDRNEPTDTLRNLLATTVITLDETSPSASRLECPSLPGLLADTGCRLEVARFVKGGEWQMWDPLSPTHTLPPCSESERCEFVQMRASLGQIAASWLQRVTIDPPIELSRDRKAFVAILGVRDFFRYLQNLIDDGTGASDSSDLEQIWSRTGVARPFGGADGFFRLESLLRRLCVDHSRYTELDETIARYKELLRESSVEDEQSGELNRFLTTWDAIAAGMAMQ